MSGLVEVLEDLAEGAFDSAIVDASDAATAESLEKTGEEVTQEVVDLSGSVNSRLMIFHSS